jgi:hypothetical protein
MTERFAEISGHTDEKLPEVVTPTLFINKELAPRVGLEPTTNGLTVDLGHNRPPLHTNKLKHLSAWRRVA